MGKTKTAEEYLKPVMEIVPLTGKGVVVTSVCEDCDTACSDMDSDCSGNECVPSDGCEDCWDDVCSDDCWEDDCGYCEDCE